MARVARDRLAVAGSAALAVTLALSPAFAQAPAAPPPAPAAAAPAEAAKPPTAPVAPPAVAVAALAAPDQFSIGAPGPGLGADLWAGSSAAIARAVIPTLAPRSLSPAAATLAREALATAAQGPPGAGDDPDLQGARMAALLALGDASTVAAVADRSTALARSESQSRAASEADLIVGRVDAACAVGTALHAGRDGPWWLRLRSFCLAQAGKAAEAQLAFNLAVQGGASPGFQRLMGVKLAGSGEAGAASAVDGLDYALSRELKLDLAPAMATAPPAVLAVLAQDAAASPAARLVASAYALRLNLVPGPIAHAVYLAGAAAPAAAPPAPTLRPAATPGPGRRTGRGGRAAARSSASPGLDVAGEAARFAAVQAAPDPAGKIAAMADLLGHAESPAGFAALARLVQPELAGLAPAGVPGARGVLFASAAAAAQDAASAQAFRAKLSADGADAVSADDLALLDGLIAAAGASAPGPVLDRLAERGTTGDARAAARAQAACAMLLGLADLRASAPGGDARAAFARFNLGPVAASPARLLALDAAADAGLKGDAALLALSIAEGAVAEGSGSGAIGPADRARIVRALARAGLRPDAARLALEGLIELQRR